MEETVKKENQEDYVAVEVLSVAINQIKNRGLSVQSITDLLKLKVRLKNYLEDIRQVQLAIMEKYEVPDEGGTYNYIKHKDSEQIIKDLAEARRKKVTVEPINFIPVKELVAATTDVSIDVLTLLYEKLAKEE